MDLEVKLAPVPTLGEKMASFLIFSLALLRGERQGEQAVIYQPPARL
jgi:hypothetical protein